MSDAPIKLTLKADWGISESKTGDKKLHGRIYRSGKDGSFMFVSAAYDGDKVKFRAWPCTRTGQHDKKPRFCGTDLTINEFLSRFGYINVEDGNYQRHAHLTDLTEETAADGSPMEIATYHVSPPLGSSRQTSTVEVVTKYVGRNSNVRAVRVIYPDGTLDTTESIGWDTDAQALGKLGISVTDTDDSDWVTTPRRLLADAMRHNHDTGDIIQLGGGNWDAQIDVRTDRPDLTAWTEQYVYTLTADGDNTAVFTPAPRNPRLPRHARSTRTKTIRALFIEGASGTYTRKAAATLFDEWYADEHAGMDRPLTIKGTL